MAVVKEEQKPHSRRWGLVVFPAVDMHRDLALRIAVASMYEQAVGSEHMHTLVAQGTDVMELSELYDAHLLTVQRWTRKLDLDPQVDHREMVDAARRKRKRRMAVRVAAAVEDHSTSHEAQMDASLLRVLRCIYCCCSGRCRIGRQVISYCR